MVLLGEMQKLSSYIWPLPLPVRLLRVSYSVVVLWSADPVLVLAKCTSVHCASMDLLDSNISLHTFKVVTMKYLYCNFLYKQMYVQLRQAMVILVIYTGER